MNYYNPYFYTMPYPKVGLFKRLFGNMTLNGFINNTERIVNIANQAIPLVREVKPILGNAKTMFKVMNEFKKNENTTSTKKETYNQNGPKFFA